MVGCEVVAELFYPRGNGRRELPVRDEEGMDEKPSNAILHWPKGERPRERLLEEGPGSLTDAQLLAIVLRVGRHKTSAVEVGMDLLKHLGGLQGLANRGVQELCAVPGIGPTKVAQIKAAIELGKRVLSAPLTTGTVITQSQTVFDHYYPLLRDLRRELFKVILLDAKHAVIREKNRLRREFNEQPGASEGGVQ